MSPARPIDPEDVDSTSARASTGRSRQGSDEPVADTDAQFETAAPVSASRAVGVDPTPTIIESHGDPVIVDSTAPGAVLVEPAGDVDGPAHRRSGPADTSPVSEDAPVAPRPTLVQPVVPLTETAPVSASAHIAEPTRTHDDEPTPAVEAVPGQTPPPDANVVTAPTAPAADADATPTQVAPVTPPAPVAPQTVYVQQPAAPKKRGNRGFGVLMSVLGTIVFALVWAGVAALIIAVSAPDRFSESMSTFVVSAAFLTPIAVFLVAMLLLALLVNRGGWPWYIIGGFVVGLLVYGGYLLGGIITVSQRITQDEVQGFVTSIAITPFAIAAGVVAREVALWTGLAISARGKRVKSRNVEARSTFEREQAERTSV
ncbi:hypothetical protein [Naasia lichenicola]|uniref:Uncharacterized protein n=1 Tax=Naasia lichenicola TaxID=2565933 RepID=A0A4S4FH82_9MICO|nr:hypothetical protein [Naasia lichenicola]THG29659.1 hypothetical protein E6C64_13395 [Naasia lichenicola]